MNNQGSIPQRTVLLLGKSSLLMPQLTNLINSFGDLRVEKTFSVRDALSIIMNIKPGLIISEWELVDHSVIELLQILQSKQEWAKIPVLILLGETDDEQLSQARSSSAKAILRQPLKKQQLFPYLQELFPSHATKHKSGRSPETIQPEHGDKHSIRDRLEKIDKLAPLPIIVQEIFEISDDPGSSARDLAKVIQKDQSITAKILRIVNSAYYGFYRKVGSVSHAIVILGFNEVKNISIAACMVQAFSEGYNKLFNRKEFWTHSLGAAFTAKALSRELIGVKPDDAFVAGLLHDIGKVVLDQHFMDAFTETLTAARIENRPLNKVSNELLGIDHAEIGGLISERWKLPNGLVEAISYHHSPGIMNQHDYLTHLAHLSNYFCHRHNIGSSGNPLPDAADPQSLAALGLENNSLEEIWKSLEIDPASLKAIFD